MLNQRSYWEKFICLACVVSMAGPLFAQEPANQSAANGVLALEEILVTAARRETTLQDIPVAVSAFDANEIERRQAFNVVDIVNNVPNLVGSNNIGQGTATTVFLRGVGTTESIVTVDTAMGFYIDDVYIARQGVNNFSLYDIERVEVLRGPQGTLYGRNSSAGAISIVTKQPGEEFEAAGEFSVGEYSRWNIKGSVNAPLIEDKLFLRLNALVQQGDGYSRNTTLNQDVNDRDHWGARASLRYLANPNLEVLFTIDHSESKENGLYASDVSGITRPTTGDLFTVVSGTDTTNLGEAEGANLTFNWSNSDTLQFQSITSFRNTYQKWNLDLTDQVLPIFLLWTINDSDQFSQEFKLTGDLMDDRLHYVSGIFYFDESSFSFIGDEINLNLGPGGRLPLPFFERDYDVNTESIAIYAEGTYDFSDRMRFIAGGRFTKDDKSMTIDFKAGGTPPGFDAVGGFPAWDSDTLNALGIPTELEFEEFTPKLGIQFDINEDVTSYLTYTKGFKSGGWGARTNDPTTVAVFDPEIVNSYALGFKVSAMEGRARINAEGFFYDYEDLFNTGTGDGGNFIVASNDAEVKGIEIEATIRVSDSVDVFGYVAWSDGKYIGVDPDLEGTVVGSELQRLPEYSTKLGFSYTRPLSSGNLRINADYSFQKDHFTNLQNTELARSGDISLLNASIGYETGDGRYGISLGCRNCVDNEYINQSLDFAGTGFIVVYPGEPSTWLLTLTARSR
jgi:iron complex outermembrane receptor protein